MNRNWFYSNCPPILLRMGFIRIQYTADGTTPLFQLVGIRGFGQIIRTIRVSVEFEQLVHFELQASSFTVGQWQMADVSVQPVILGYEIRFVYILHGGGILTYNTVFRLG